MGAKGDNPMSAADELYAAAKAVDDVAQVNSPVHAFSDFTVPYSQMGALMRALRRFEREDAK